VLGRILLLIRFIRGGEWLEISVMGLFPGGHKWAEYNYELLVKLS
jgi:hypothetical protein